MSTPISGESAAAFLARFRNFYDGVIRRMAFDFTRDSYLRTVVVDLLGRDREAGDAWVLCTLKIIGLEEFVIREQKSSFLVLSDGIKFIWAADRAYIDFGTVEDEPNLDEIRAAGFYLSGREVEWSVRPLGENEWS